jgi:outer membrane receptor protein involved in Fe transport
MPIRIARPALVSIAVSSLLATGSVVAAEEEEMEELEAVVVTGSRIPTVRTEGPSPVTVITADDIAERSFTTIQEVTNSLTQITGTAQNELQAGSFTQNANAIELRGLGPGRTLVLVDGRRVADYPLPYNGESNFVNLSSIPAAAVERIELLSSGASAIYGSDAVAGVLNVVLKKRVENPISFEVRYGDTTQGGGESVRVQAVTGGSIGNLDLLVAGEIFDRKPIYSYQRDFQDSVDDNPAESGRIAGRSLLRLDPFDFDDDGQVYVDPGEAACEPFSETMEYSFRPGSGYYCGQRDYVSQSTLRNARKRSSVLVRANYGLGATELYGSASLYNSSDRLDPDFSWFSSELMIPGDTGYLFDVSEDPYGIGGNFALVQRFFQPWEIGGYGARQERVKERLLDYHVGVRGDLGGSNWKYDLTLSGSDYGLKDYRNLLLNEPLLDYFFGPQLTDEDGELMYEDVSPFGMPMYAVNWDRVYSPITPAIWQQLTGQDVQDAESSSRTATLVFNGDLWSLPSGPLASAIVLEAAKQDYEIGLSDALQNGEYWGLVGTGGGGKRNRYAAGVELSVPVIEMLKLQLAGRYDHYDDITEVNGAFTYNAGLEFRPLPQLLVRGTYATSFRAPDMHYVFADPSGYFTSATDQYLCRRDEPGTPLSACTITSGDSLEGQREGNPFLVEEKGKSYTFGFAAEPFSGLRFTADYYHIKLTGGVKDDSETLLLETEADCRLGETISGVPVDINSVKCQSALSRVQRRPDDGGLESEFLQLVTTGPINTALHRTSGIDLALDYNLSPGGGTFGRFNFSATFTQVLKNERLDFAGDEVEDLLELRSWPDWHSRLGGGLTWTRGPFTTTAFVQRYGSIWNWAETERLPSYVLTNLSARYSGLMKGEAYVGVAVQNLFDKNPPRDETWDVWPYYSQWNYNPVGREVFVEIGTRF